MSLKSLVKRLQAVDCFASGSYYYPVPMEVSYSDTLCDRIRFKRRKSRMPAYITPAMMNTPEATYLSDLHGDLVISDGNDNYTKYRLTKDDKEVLINHHYEWNEKEESKLNFSGKTMEERKRELEKDREEFLNKYPDYFK